MSFEEGDGGRGPSNDGLPPLREVIAAHDLAAKKSLGQNFLLDLNLTGRIARTAGSLDDHDVLEIGPGPGGLTRALLHAGARKVTAVERDSRCLSALAEVAAHYPGRLEVLEGDALKLNPIPGLRRPLRICANLPYNVGTELFTRWLTDPVWPEGAPCPWASLTLMFQREVAERITAQPGDNHWGRLAVLSQWRSTARIAFEVSPKAFTPPPKVWSAIVHVTPLDAPRFPAEAKVLSQITQAAFGQRRKMLRQSLKQVSPDPMALCAAAGVEPTARPETLDLGAFCALARALSDQRAS
ncbi:16S rRNA (adenine(1518)-N(6)/adenine(1519)-N(6))-dimethyltransferase RsmA [Rhodovulum sp. DZ06]|uniref:16S rRNA (adenine(1518)-N(6)/adenine(1519)-N(6))- dimethyltransferase RsmA n=1 Tax=Rhodovulum sp. DZ06 TaxID=3425126 RepID=UPI003D337028